MKVRIYSCAGCQKSIPCRCEGSHYEMSHAHSGIHGDTIRCRPCWESFNRKNQEERDKNKPKCLECGAPAYIDLCEECCEHNDVDPDEGYHCLDCGKDCSEDVFADAYDRAKDIAKYGE